MKKSVSLLGIGLLATAIIDLSFPLRTISLSFALATTVFFLAGYLFYERIMEKPIINSILILSFILALMSYGYIVNTNASLKWTLIIACSLMGYLSGLVAKNLQKKKNTYIAEQSIDK